MNSALDRIIIDCLDAVEKGQSIDSIVKAHPEHSAELMSILETAESLNNFRVAHSLEAQAQSRKRFLEEAVAIQTAGRDRGIPLFIFWRRLAYSVGIIAMILILFSAAVVYASQSALPGDTLYGAKRTIEDFRLSLTTDRVLYDTLGSQFENERISEIEALLNSGRDIDDLEFSGELSIQEDGDWIIAGLPIELTEATIISGQPETGHWVQVKANLKDGKLFALEISSLGLQEIRPDPESDGIPSPPVEEKPTPADTPGPVITTTPPPHPEDTDFSTETPTTNGSSSPTPILSPTIEASPSPEDEINDNGEDDNSNEEEDSSGPGDDDGEEEDSSGSGDDDCDEEEDNSSSGGDNCDEEEDNSGSGGDDGEEEDSSGSGGGDDCDEEEDNSSSGGDDCDEEEDNSGSGDDDGEEEDSSGSGGGDDNENSSNGSDTNDNTEEEEESSND